MIAFMQRRSTTSCAEAGELVFARGLVDGSQAKTVRLDDGVPVATDGPYAESKESLVGYWVLDVDDEARDPRDRRPDREVRSQRGRGAPGRRRPAGGVTTDRGSRTCCASWRRRSSARSCAGTASSTPARTPSRRRCSRRRCSGRPTGCRTARGPGWSPSRRAGWSTSGAARAPGRRREETAAALDASGTRPAPEHDDTLTLLFLCCHPSLSVPSQLALTLRAVGGLTTAEIAQRVPGAGGDDGPADQPRQADHQGRRRRLRAAAGRRTGRAAARRACTCSTSSSTRATRPPPAPPQRADLTAEAIRLARLLHAAAPRRARGRGAARADAAHRGPAAGADRPPTARWCRWPSRTRARGTRADRGGRRAAHRGRSAAGRSARTSCRRRSPPCTTRRRARRTPTGRRSSRCTTCSSSVSPGPVVTLNRAVARGDGPRAAGRAGAARHAGERRAHGAHAPARRGARPPARARRGHRCGARVLPPRGADDEERSGAAIPCTTCGRARKKFGVGVGSRQRRS